MARQAAESGISFARAWIAKTSNWRTGQTVSFTNVTLGKATFDVLITDPTDNDVSNRPYDPVDITCTARAGRAEQIMTAHLTASPQAYDSFSYALSSIGQVVNGNRLIVGSATVSTNNQLDNNNGTIEGNVTTVSVKKAGTVTGTTTVSSSTRTVPSGASIAEWYASIGTQLSGVTTINKALLSSNANPWGAPNSDGIYYIRTSSDVTISNCRIAGTLVVIAPNNKVTVSGNVLIEPTSRDYPALIVVGKLAMNDTTVGQTLSEATVGVNLNPVGSEYNGVANANATDTYPSEIHGLVHCTSDYSSGGDNTIRGLLLVEGDMKPTSAQTIFYNNALAYWPPAGYAKRVDMPLTMGSLQRVVR